MKVCDLCRREQGVSTFSVGVSRVGGPLPHDLRGRTYDLCGGCYARLAGLIQERMNEMVVTPTGGEEV